MAIYSKSRQYIFFANPQTASKAISLTLRKKLDGVRMPRFEVRREGEVIAQQHHTTYSQILNAELLTEGQLAELFKFTCIRNPFDQMVSKYLKYCERFENNPSNYKWLRGIDHPTVDHSFPQWFSWISKHYIEIDKINTGPMDFVRHADLVIRFEKLQDGFNEFLHHIGEKEEISVFQHNVTEARIERPDKQVTRKRRYTEYYDDATVAAVERLYKPVIDRFHYKFGD